MDKNNGIGKHRYRESSTEDEKRIADIKIVWVQTGYHDLPEFPCQPTHPKVPCHTMSVIVPKSPVSPCHNYQLFRET